MILVLGGTSDATALAKALQKQITEKVIVSTATEYGFHTADKDFDGEVIWGRKNKEALAQLLLDRQIRLLVDGTHPFAGDVSENAIQACTQTGVNYLRYERPPADSADNAVTLCDSYEQAGKLAEELLQKLPGMVFITTGSRHAGKVIGQIRDWSRIRVRVLPVSESILELERLGLKAEHIIAMKGPFSEDMNLLMMKECHAAVMVTKDSGVQGGMPEKLKAAGRLGIHSLVIKRPEIAYPNKYQSIGALIDAVKALLNEVSLT